MQTNSSSRAEGRFDAVEVAGVGRGRHELHVVGVGEGANLGRPVAGEAVLDPVDADRARVGAPDRLHEGERGAAVAAWPRPDPQVVGVDVERADQVADPLPTVERRAVPLGPAVACPTAPVFGAEALRPLLVEADHDTVCRLLLVEGEDPRRLGGVVGVGALFPTTRALQRDPVAGEDPGEMGRRDLDPLRVQVARELREAPARVRHPERVGTGAGDRDDPLLVVSRDPAGSPAPKTRAQRLEPVPVEVMDHLAHVRLVGEQHARDLRRAHQRVRREQDQRPMPRRRHASTASTAASTAAPHAAPTRARTPPGDASTPPQVACIPIRHGAGGPARFRSNIQRGRTSCAAGPASCAPASSSPGPSSCAATGPI